MRYDGDQIIIRAIISDTDLNGTCLRSFLNSIRSESLFPRGLTITDYPELDHWMDTFHRCPSGTKTLRVSVRRSGRVCITPL